MIRNYPRLLWFAEVMSAQKVLVTLSKYVREVGILWEILLNLNVRIIERIHGLVIDILIL